MKYAWVIFFAFGILQAFVGLLAISEGLSYVKSFQAAGFSFDQATGYAIQGLALFTLGITYLTIAGIPYRKGEKWAWYFALFFVVSAPVGEILVGIYSGASVASQSSDFVSLAIGAVGLLLPVRKFFPKQQPSSAAAKQ